MSTCADDLSHAPAQAAGSEWRPLAYMSYEELAAGAFVETRPTAPISYRVDVGKGGIAGDRPQRPAGMAPLGGDVCVRGGPDGVVTEASCGVRPGARLGSTGHHVGVRRDARWSGATAPNGPVSRRGVSRAVHERAEGMCGVLGGNGVATERPSAVTRGVVATARLLGAKSGPAARTRCQFPSLSFVASVEAAVLGRHPCLGSKQWLAYACITSRFRSTATALARTRLARSPSASVVKRCTNGLSRPARSSASMVRPAVPRPRICVDALRPPADSNGRRHGLPLCHGRYPRSAGTSDGGS